MRKALRHPAFRAWFLASLVGNTGTWMQRIAQDWVVTTDIAPGSGFALGLIGAMQFAPTLVLSPLVGMLADRFPQRRLLLGSQVAGVVLALAQGMLLLSGLMQLWHVALFAVGSGAMAAFDATLRQTFVGELLPSSLLHVGVGLNAMTFNVAALLGPALAGVVIAGVGAAGAMFANALSFLVSLSVLVVVSIRTGAGSRRSPPGDGGSLLVGLRFLLGRRDLAAMLIPLVAISAIGMQLPITSPLIAAGEFRQSAIGYSVLTAANALGAVAGSLLATRIAFPGLRAVLLTAGTFGVCMLLLSGMPTFWSYAAVLVAVGGTTVVFTTICQVMAQTSAPEAMKGRVVAAYMAVYLGTVPVGSLVVGAIAEAYGPRWGVVLGGVAAIAACVATIPVLRWRSR